MEKFLIDLFTNPIFISAGGGWLSSQVVKTILQIPKLSKGHDLSILLTGGGMPSSHTATATGLLVSTTMVYGGHGFEFPMAFFFWMVLIVDALNVRYQSGQMGKFLNHAKKHLCEEDPYYKQFVPFRESIGHTLPEVIVGGILGAAAAVIATNILT